MVGEVNIPSAEANFKDRYMMKNYVKTSTLYYDGTKAGETKEDHFGDSKVSLDPRTGYFEDASGTFGLHFENAIYTIK